MDKKKPSQSLWYKLQVVGALVIKELMTSLSRCALMEPNTQLPTWTQIYWESWCIFANQGMFKQIGSSYGTRVRWSKPSQGLGKLGTEPATASGVAYPQANVKLQPTVQNPSCPPTATKKRTNIDCKMGCRVCNWLDTSIQGCSCSNTFCSFSDIHETFR